MNLFERGRRRFVIVLVPWLYGTYRLFTHADAGHHVGQPVARSQRERRIAGFSLIARMKVQGSGLRPLLRATIDDAPALGFVFEISELRRPARRRRAAGLARLVLYDGVQEVGPRAEAVPPSAGGSRATATSRRA